MTEDTPEISVIMSVWNGECHLREAVDSILNQTFDDFEFIIINDGSSDKTRHILESYDDPRIRIIHQENTGLTRALNKGIQVARGQFLARMDADDISLPERLAKQRNVLNSDASMSVVYTVAKWFGTREKIVNSGNTCALMPITLLDANCLTHGSVMMRKDDLLEVNGYDEHFRYAQDHDLWLRLAWRGKRFHLIDEVLFMSRAHAETITDSSHDEQWALSREARLRVIRGIRRGTYAVSSELKEPLADVLLKLAHRWLKRGWNTDARKAALAHLRMRPSSATAMKILARSCTGVRQCYDALAAVRQRVLGGVRNDGET